MVKNMLFYLLTFSAVFLSCDSLKEDNKIQLEEKSYSWSFNNDQLKEQVLSYFNTVDTDHFQNGVLYIGVRNEAPFVKYVMHYITSISFFEEGYVHVITHLNGHVVCVYFNSEDIFNPTFKLTDESIIKMMKANFPEDYAHFMKVMKNLEQDSTYYGNDFQLKDAFPIPSTWAPEAWTLTFRDGKLIDKKIENQGE